MARINIYVPDELKQRMDQFPRRDWSKLLRQVIEARVQRLERTASRDIIDVASK